MCFCCSENSFEYLIDNEHSFDTLFQRLNKQENAWSDAAQYSALPGLHAQYLNNHVTGYYTEQINGHLTALGGWKKGKKHGFRIEFHYATDSDVCTVCQLQRFKYGKIYGKLAKWDMQGKLDYVLDLDNL